MICSTFRYDGELSKVNECLRIEKSERDSIKRGKDEITAEKNILEELNKVNLLIIFPKVCCHNFLYFKTYKREYLQVVKCLIFYYINCEINFTGSISRYGGAKR